MPPRQRCESCHASQKSCDKKRPACGRCVARLKECIYQPSDTFSFVDQNGFSAELSRRAASRESHSPKTIDVSSLLPMHALVHQIDTKDRLLNLSAQPYLHSLAAPPSWTLDDRVLARFFSRWATGYTCVGNQNFILRTYEDSGPHSALHSAIRAIAYADLAVVERHGDRRSKSFQAYFTSLRRIQDYLNESTGPESIPSDAVFTAIMVVDSFEVNIRR